MLKIHCNGCDVVIKPFHSRLRFYAGVWKADKGKDLEDPIDVCDECLRKNPLLGRIFEQIEPARKPQS